jgi:putative transposase
MDIFLDEQDYQAFLTRLRVIMGKEELPKVPFGKWKRKQRLTPCPPNAFSVICYCLMPNHWHFVIEQRTELPISSLLLKVCTSYAKYFNKKYDRVGHVFQDQFCAVMTESDQQLDAVSAYVHQNPKVAGLVQELHDWKYSSYPAYVDLDHDPLLDLQKITDRFRDATEYRTFVEDRFSEILERKEIAGLMLD